MGRGVCAGLGICAGRLADGGAPGNTVWSHWNPICRTSSPDVGPPHLHHNSDDAPLLPPSIHPHCIAQSFRAPAARQSRRSRLCWRRRGCQSVCASRGAWRRRLPAGSCATCTRRRRCRRLRCLHDTRRDVGPGVESRVSCLGPFHALSFRDLVTPVRDRNQGSSSGMNISGAQPRGCDRALYLF